MRDARAVAARGLLGEHHAPEVSYRRAGVVEGGGKVEERSVDAVVDAHDLVEAASVERCEAIFPGTEVVARIGPWQVVVDEFCEVAREASASVRHEHQSRRELAVGPGGVHHVRIEAALRVEVGQHDRAA